ncbi:MAG: DUF1080 domain-containing protein [Bacteroidetes bacterium]|nr:DUF1080 domain-containing protein [Bacteroidota bacterium]
MTFFIITLQAQKPEETEGLSNKSEETEDLSKKSEETEDLSMKPEETEDWSKKPERVTPGKGTLPPSDAIILYANADDAEKWEGDQGDPIKWEAGENLTVAPKTKGIRTKQNFGDVQLHIEWRSPIEVSGNGQGRGNSGVFLMEKYELQVLDSYENETYFNGQAGSIYKQYIPLVNACRPPGSWQSYDAIFTAPRFNEDSSLQSAAYITVFHNGVLIQNHVELKGPTKFIGNPKYIAHPDKLPLALQNHGNPVSYRNIWIREL